MFCTYRTGGEEMVVSYKEDGSTQGTWKVTHILKDTADDICKSENIVICLILCLIAHGYIVKRTNIFLDQCHYSSKSLALTRPI